MNRSENKYTPLFNGTTIKTISSNDSINDNTLCPIATKESTIVAFSKGNYEYKFPLYPLFASDEQGEQIDVENNEIPIVVRTPYPENTKSSDKTFKGIKECGFNTIMNRPEILEWNTDEANTNPQTLYLREMLTQCNTHRLKVILGQRNLYESNQMVTINGKTHELQSTIDLVKSLKDNPAIGGWWFKDYPMSINFENLLSKYADIYNDSNEKIVYFCLEKENWGSDTVGCPNIISYLNKVQTVFQPAVWAFTSYPFYKNGDTIDIGYKDFFKALELYSFRSRFTSRPFWSFIQTLHYFNGISITRPEATLPLMKFQAYTALAYGAQGIIYSDYAVPVKNPGTASENYSALLDKNGNYTQAWYDAQKLNKLLKSYSSIFKGCQVQLVQIAGGLMGSPCKSLVLPFGPVTYFSGDATFSLIANLASRYVVIVSRKPLSSHQVKIKFSQFFNVYRVDANVDNGSLSETIVNTESTLSYDLEAGDCMIFKFTGINRNIIL